MQRQPRPYNLQLQSPLNSQWGQVGNREFTIDGLRMRSFPLISDAMPSLLHWHTLFFIHNNIPFTDSQHRVTVTISTLLYSIPLPSISMSTTIYTLINTIHIHISVPHHQHAASTLLLSTLLTNFSWFQRKISPLFPLHFLTYDCIISTFDCFFVILQKMIFSSFNGLAIWDHYLTLCSIHMTVLWVVCLSQLSIHFSEIPPTGGDVRHRTLYYILLYSLLRHDCSLG